MHGSFDLIQTPDGEYVFLEMNEMGQFLWLEERLPEIPALNMFASFALNPSNTFEYREHERLPATSFKDYLATPDCHSFRQRLSEAGERGANHYKVNYVE